MEGFLGPRAGLDVSGKKMFSCLYRNSNPGSSNSQPGYYNDCAIPGPNQWLQFSFKCSAYILHNRLKNCVVSKDAIRSLNVVFWLLCRCCKGQTMYCTSRILPLLIPARHPTMVSSRRGIIMFTQLLHALHAPDR